MPLNITLHPAAFTKNYFHAPFPHNGSLCKGRILLFREKTCVQSQLQCIKIHKAPVFEREKSKQVKQAKGSWDAVCIVMRYTEKSYHRTGDWVRWALLLRAHKCSEVNLFNSVCGALWSCCPASLTVTSAFITPQSIMIRETCLLEMTRKTRQTSISRWPFRTYRWYIYSVPPIL